MINLLIPVYNEIKHLPALFTYLQQQIDQNFQCIIIDDGSTDNSVAIAQKLASSMSNVRIIQKSTNTGLSSTIRYGASFVAETDYIMMLDADDRIYPETIYQLNRLLQQHPALDAIEYSFYNDISRQYCIDILQFHNQLLLSPTEIDLYRQKGLDNRYMLVRWNKLIKKSLWNKITQYYLDGLNYLEDVMFGLAYYYSITTNMQILIYNQPLMKYHKTSNRMSTSLTNINKIQSAQRLYPMLQALPIDTSKYEQRVNMFLHKNLTEAKI